MLRIGNLFNFGRNDKTTNYRVTVSGIIKKTGKVLYVDILKREDSYNSEETFTATAEEVSGYKLLATEDPVKTCTVTNHSITSKSGRITFYYEEAKVEIIQDPVTLDLRNDKIVLVSGSGGLKGAFEVGCYKYFEEIGILDQFDGYVGTSIGSINTAGLMCMTMDELENLWLNIKQTDIYNGELTSIENKQLDELMQKLLADKNYGDLMIILVAVINQFNGTGCLDNSPLKEFLNKKLDLDAIYANPNDFALCTLNLKTLKREVYSKANTPKEDFVERVMESSSAFPVFPLRDYKGGKYIDGGFYPSAHNYDVAFDNLGATKAVVIDILAYQPSEEAINDPNTIYIYAEAGTIGSFLDMSDIPGAIQVGYNAAKKAFQESVNIIK